MKNRSVGLNAFLNVLRTVLALIVPLITYPYISRILGAENLGKVNYVHSIISYFILISGLGISTYGVREGAKIRHENEGVSKLISECFSIALIMTVVSYLILCLLVSIIPAFERYKRLFLIECLLIVFDTIGIEWVNTIFEDYLYITIRTIIVHLISIIAIFMLIHSRDDVYIYAGITVGTTGLVSIINWFHCNKKCKIRITVSNDIKVHIKPILVFFANKLAVTLYVNSDMTMLGYMTGDYRVGIYSVAVKVYTIVKNMLAAMYAVTIPRLSSKIGRNDDEGFRTLFSQLVSFMILIILPATLGLFMLSSNITLLLFGEEYVESALPLRILSVGIIFAIFGGIVTSVFNVTKNLEMNSLQGTILAAALNISLNFVLIPAFREVGAAITTVLAELTTFIYCFVRAKDIKNYLNAKLILKNAIHAAIGCAEILGITLLFNVFIEQNLLYIMLSIIVSVLIYGLSLIVLNNDFAKKLLRSIVKTRK